MRLYYFREKKGNFGDDLNAWLWEALAPGVWNDADDVAMSAIGTLIGNEMPRMRRWIVFGSGAGYFAPPVDFGASHWTIVAVRGPLTAEALGLPPGKALTDGAILLAALPRYAPLPESERSGVVFMPHYRQLRFGRWREACERAGVEFLDPTADSRRTLERLQRAKLVLANAMHAAICADALRVPWIAVAISSELSTFKWLDWTLSMAVPHTPRAAPCSSLLERLQSWAYRVSGTGHTVPDQGKRAVLEHYRRTIARRSGRLKVAVRIAIKATLAALQTLAGLPLIERLYRRYDDRQLAKAAAALIELVRAPACLSADAIFEQRLAEMQRLLREIRLASTPSKHAPHDVPGEVELVLVERAQKNQRGAVRREHGQGIQRERPLTQ